MEVRLDVLDFDNKEEILNAVSKALDLFNNKKFVKKINSSNDVFVVKIDESNKLIFRKCRCDDENHTPHSSPYTP